MRGTPRLGAAVSLLLQLVDTPEAHPSGVYLSFRINGNPVLRGIKFEELDRLAIAERAGGW